MAGMKIATFNINNVNRRLPNLLDWLNSATPDIVCLQELKCADTENSRPKQSGGPDTTRCGTAKGPGTGSQSWGQRPS